MLGDRSLKLKYLNPNTLFVATGTQPGQADGTERHITAHIFDTVTGQLLFSQAHEVGRHVIMRLLVLSRNPTACIMAGEPSTSDSLVAGKGE